MKGVFFKKGTFLYPGMRYGGLNPLTIHEIYAALTPSDSQSDWATELNMQRIIKSKVKICVPVHQMSVF